jgi:hypothetical protein
MLKALDEVGMGDRRVGGENHYSTEALWRGLMKHQAGCITKVYFIAVPTFWILGNHIGRCHKGVEGITEKQ